MTGAALSMDDWPSSTCTYGMAVWWRFGQRLRRGVSAGCGGCSTVTVSDGGGCRPVAANGGGGGVDCGV